MTISKEASVLINETLKKYNKEVLAFKYIKSLEQMSVSILTKEEAIDFEELDGVLVKFIDEAKNATKNWSIVEENGKLTIQKKCKCCTDDCCEYVCNKITPECSKNKK